MRGEMRRGGPRRIRAFYPEPSIPQESGCCLRKNEASSQAAARLSAAPGSGEVPGFRAEILKQRPDLVGAFLCHQDLGRAGLGIDRQPYTASRE